MVAASDLLWAERHVSGNKFSANEDLEDYLDMVMERKGWRMPGTPVDARMLYNNLVSTALNGG